MGKRSSRRGQSDTELQITSMMDIMTIILVFLLKSYATEDISVAPSDDLRIPVSTSLKAPKLAVNVIVSKRDIVVDGKWVLNLETTVDEETGEDIIIIPEGEKRGQMITLLYEELDAKADTAKSLGERAGGDEFGFQGQLLLQCDRTLPFSVIREVMFTAGQAQFGEFRFVVIKGAG